MWNTKDKEYVLFVNNELNALYCNYGSDGNWVAVVE